MFEALGHYKILERVGAGGIGEVYRARDTRLGRTVAITVVTPAIAANPADRERFLADARAAAALSHPNIAALYEVDEDQEQLFLAIEFVPGETLRAAVAGRPMNAMHAIELATQIADALADAHAEGLIHGDIKPDNIIVTPKGRAKVLELGLSAWTGGGAARRRIAAQSLDATASGAPAMRAAAYLSPEQALGEPIDHRSDIFSLGVVLFEMLTGRLPFTATAAGAMALQVVQAPIPAPSSFNAALPEEVDAIVLKALARSLDERYESAATLAAELRSLGAVLEVRAETAETKRPSPPPRIAARSRTPWLLILVIVTLVAAVIAWMYSGQ